jgi:hypothetical protein
VDEDRYREAREIFDGSLCPFSKAVLTRCCECERSMRINVAEREVVNCASSEARTACLRVLDLLKSNARFALKLPNAESPLSHAQAMKLQCGGLLGLQETVFPERSGESRVSNIYGLISDARRIFGRVDALPFGDIVRRISSYENRRRSKAKPP